MSKYPNLFSPIRLGYHTIKNRIVMPAMGTNFANPDGTVSPKILAHYTERAQGGVGLIIVEVTAVDFPKGKTIANQLRINDYNVIPGWRELADSVHLFGAKIICQLHHAGSLSSRGKANGNQPVAPSDFSSGGFTETESCRAMTVSEIQDVIDKFVQAAVYAKMAGLDGIEIHAAHGYLISQFLSPVRNKRIDEYGGDINNRARFLVSIIDGIRKACGKELLLSVRIPAHDAVPGGLTLEDGAEIAKLVESAGADLINVSSGVFSIPQMLSSGPVSMQNFTIKRAKSVKPNVNSPISIFGITDPEICEQVVAEGISDMIVKGRQLLCDPYWPLKLEGGRENDIRTCLECHEGCIFNLLVNESPIQCAINPYVGRENQTSETRTAMAGRKKKVVIVGAGIAGMQAAITAFKRGHDTILIDKSENVGGQLKLASVPPNKERIHQAVKWFKNEINKSDINFQTGVDADAGYLFSLKPDVVIVATGSRPMTPQIEGIENAVQSWDILSGVIEMPKNKRIVIIGGGIVGCETAEFLAKAENDITIIEMLPYVAINSVFKRPLPPKLAKMGIKTEVLARVNKVTGNQVLFTNKDNEQKIVESDMVILSCGQQSIGRDLTSELRDKGIHTVTVGDATVIGNIRSAVHSGFHAAFNL